MSAPTSSATPYRAALVVIALALVISVAMPTIATAQDAPQPAPTTSPSPTAPARVADLEKALAETLTRAANAQAALGTSDPAQTGATAEELQQRVDLLEQQALYYRVHLDALRSIELTRKAAKELADEIANWKGFPDPPPYPVQMVDDLRQARRAQAFDERRDLLRRGVAQSSIERARNQLRDAEQQLRLATEQLEAARSDQERLRARWRRDLATLEVETARVFLVASDAFLRSLDERVALHRQRNDFLKRKVEVASKNTHFPKKDFDRKLAAIDTDIRAVTDEAAKTDAAERSTATRLEAAREKLATTGTEGAARAAAQAAVETLRLKSEVLRAAAEEMSMHLSVLQTERSLWQQRFQLATDWNVAAAKSALDTIAESQRKAASVAGILEAASRQARDLALKTPPPETAGDPAQQALRTAANARAIHLETALRHLTRLQDFLEIWREEEESRLAAGSGAERRRDWLVELGAWCTRIWNYELFSAEDTLIVDGQRLVERRPVTVSKLVYAVLILVAGFFVANLLAHAASAAVRRFWPDKAHSAPVARRIMRLALGGAVVVIAMVTVKIPLTVFAFLGGALAIGVGFGAQTLINNFISGYLLLAEQPIRIGDIIEVEGTRGRVENIGARCTRMRRPDGIEILIPNSSLLEKSVTNLTLSDRQVRTSLSVGVAYGSPPAQVSDIIAAAVAAHPCVLQKPEPVVLFEDFGDNALVFTACFWIDLHAVQDARTVTSDLRHQLARRFEEAGIAIAFPQRDVHLDAARPLQVELVSPPGPSAIPSRTTLEPHT